jgi:AraC-like DNA-binding protein
MTFHLLDTVELLAAYHAGLMGLALMVRTRHQGLALMCLGFAAHMLTNLGVEQGLIGRSLDITSAFGLLYGPFFYLFVRQLAFEETGLRWRDGLHLVPAIAIALFRPADPLPQILGLPSLIIYIGLGLWILRRHRRLSAELRSDDDAISLRWVEQALLVFATIAALDIARDTFAAQLGLIGADQALALVIASVIVLLSVMGLQAIRHGRRQGALPDDEASLLPTPAKSTETGPQDLEIASENFARLDPVIRDQNLWCEPRLSLDDVARLATLTPREVSRAIRLGSGQSFSRYINGLRVEAVDALMAEPDNAGRTVIELAYEVGFNSKSAFNRIYREHAGRTPSEAFSAFKSAHPSRNTKRDVPNP